MTELTAAAAFMIGLVGSTHCMAMCGGIGAALAMSGPEGRARLPRTLLYNFGRIASYTLAGALVGLLGYWLGQGLNLMGLGLGLRLALGALMIGIGLQLAINWTGLRRIESAGAVIWRRIAPLAQRLLPGRTPAHALAVGMLWGWLPCGLVYTALVAAAVSGSAWHGALVMFAFGAGTLPSMIAVGAASGHIARWSKRPGLRRLAGVSILAYGVWTLATPLLHLTHAEHSAHHAHAAPAASHESMHHHH